MKKAKLILLALIAVIVSACSGGNSFLSTIIIKNNSPRSYYYKISCSDTNFQEGGTLSSGGTIKRKVQSEHIYVVSTYEIISLQLHTSNYVNAKSDKTYTITIKN